MALAQVQRCPSCGHTSSSTARFCGQCGRSYTARPPPPPPRPRYDEPEQRVLARIHVNARPEWSEALLPRRGPAAMVGVTGTLCLTERRLVYLGAVLPGRGWDGDDIDLHMEQHGGFSIDLDAIDQTRSLVAGEPERFRGQATFCVRFRGISGTQSMTFTATEFAPDWEGFASWERAIVALRAGERPEF